MALTSDLISEFVKVTNDKEEPKKETIVYGTTVSYEGKTYVKIDGSDLLTPIITSVNTEPGERVTVMIKNHTATITGNISSPAARTDDVTGINSEYKKLNEKVAESIVDLQTTADSSNDSIIEIKILLEQLTDSIATLVTDNNGESLMIRTETGWTFSTQQIQNAIDFASANLDALLNEVNDINTTVSILEQAVRDIGALSEYIEITSYEGEPCIKIGETDSDFKLLITNRRLLFMEGSGVPVYITNQETHIKKAVVEEELTQGGFVWKIRKNGNMGLMWKGVSS